MAGEEHGIRRFAGRLREGDREPADHEPGHDREHQRPLVDEALRDARKHEDRERHDRHREREPIVQPKSLQLGPAKCGTGNAVSARALVLSPVQFPMPMNTSEPIPPASRPGSSTTGSIAPPRPVASMMTTAPITGEPKIVEIAAKLPAAAINPTAWSGASLLTTRIDRVPRPAPSAISGASGPSTSPRPRVASAASITPGQIDRPCRGTADLEAVRGDVAAAPREVHDRKRRERAGQREPRQRPPRGLRGVAEVRRQVAVNPNLDLVHSFHESPRGRRHDDADQRREHEQDAVLPAAKQRGRIDAGGWCVVHGRPTVRTELLRMCRSARTGEVCVFMARFARLKIQFEMGSRACSRRTPAA